MLHRSCSCRSLESKLMQFHSPKFFNANLSLLSLHLVKGIASVLITVKVNRTSTDGKREKFRLCDDKLRKLFLIYKRNFWVFNSYELSPLNRAYDGWKLAIFRLKTLCAISLFPKTNAKFQKLFQSFDHKEHRRTSNIALLDRSLVAFNDPHSTMFVTVNGGRRFLIAICDKCVHKGKRFSRANVDIQLLTQIVCTISVSFCLCFSYVTKNSQDNVCCRVISCFDSTKNLTNSRPSILKNFFRKYPTSSQVAHESG